jgi:alcohol dehydrogenase
LTDGTALTGCVVPFRNPTRVEFGAGAVERVAYGLPSGPVVLVTSPGSSRRGLTDRVAGRVGCERVTVIDDVRPNPDVRDLIRQLGAIPRETVAVVAVGGGSVLDSGKVLAALARARCESDPVVALEAAIAGCPVDEGGALPITCVPTTAGTGSEVTPFATLWDGAAMRKHSVGGPGLYPAAAIVDPELMLSLPEDITVYTGLDALSQGLEAYWNHNAGPVTDAFALRAIRLTLNALEPLAASLKDAELRASMAEASLLAGLAISGTRTALAHSISYPLTLHFGIPHGLACGFTLPVILDYNADSGHPRMTGLAGQLGFATIIALGDRLRGLLRGLDVAGRIRRYGFDKERVSTLGAEMITPGRADNNIRNVDGAEAARIALKSWEELDGPQT